MYGSTSQTCFFVDMFLRLFVSSTVHLVCSFVLILGSHSDNLHTLSPRDLCVLWDNCYSKLACYISLTFSVYPTSCGTKALRSHTLMPASVYACWHHGCVILRSYQKPAGFLPDLYRKACWASPGELSKASKIYHCYSSYDYRLLVSRI